MTFWIRRKIFV